MSDSPHLIEALERGLREEAQRLVRPTPPRLAARVSAELRARPRTASPGYRRILRLVLPTAAAAAALIAVLRFSGPATPALPGTQDAPATHLAGLRRLLDTPAEGLQAAGQFQAPLMAETLALVADTERTTRRIRESLPDPIGNLFAR